MATHVEDLGGFSAYRTSENSPSTTLGEYRPRLRPRPSVGCHQACGLGSLLTAQKIKAPTALMPTNQTSRSAS